MMENSFEVKDEFPDEAIEDVNGLLWLGYLEDVVDYCGHEFVIRTLRLEEQLLCSLLIKEYNETIGQGKAWVAAQVALSLISVDGDEEFCPKAGFNKKDNARGRFNYLISNWYEPTIVHIYNAYLKLLERQAFVLEEMENLSQESLSTFTASPDSSVQRADSSTVMEIMDMLETDDQD
jgi:hypothetical protein